MSEQSSDRRFGLLNQIHPEEMRIEEVIKDIQRSKSGSYQRVWEWGNFVIKEVFSGAIVPQNTTVPEGKEEMLEAKNRLERHLRFLREQFGDLFPRARCFVAANEGHYKLFKVQRNLNKSKQPFGRTYLDIGNEFSLLSDFYHDENQQLRDDFKHLYEVWKGLRSKGISLDLRFSNNGAVVVEDKYGKDVLRLKVYDSIPLFVIDKEKYSASDLPKNLIVVNPADLDNNNFVKTEEFWQFLEDWYLRVLPTYGNGPLKSKKK